jgi:hypothetical protein
MYFLGTWFVSGICVDTLHKGENDAAADDDDNFHKNVRCMEKMFSSSLSNLTVN